MPVLTNASTSQAETDRERASREVAHRAAVDGIVLLENDGALPVAPGRIALFGAGARHTIKGGTGSGEVNERHSTTIEEGLEAAGFTIGTTRWLDDYDAEHAAAEDQYGADVRKLFRRPGRNAVIELLNNPFRPPVGRAVTAADIAGSEADVCVFVVARQAGEGGDRKLDRDDYHLSHLERDNLRRCAEGFATTIVVLNVGAAFDTGFVREIPGIGGLLYICQLGSEGGRAVADVVSGRVAPSGKLTDSWARSYDDLPFAREFGSLGDVAHETYKEGIFVGYRYFDTFGVEPAYPFGYGLTYTSFAVSEAQLDVAGPTATLRAVVSNTGSTAGREVLQAYVASPHAGTSDAAQVLAAFGKTELLQPGASQALELVIDLALLAGYDEGRAAFVLAAGEHLVRVGSSSRDLVDVGALVLDAEVVVSRHRAVCPPASRVTELEGPGVVAARVDPALPRVAVAASAFTTTVHEYGDPPAVDDPAVVAAMAKLSTDELAQVVSGPGLLFLLLGGGTTHFAVPGAVGSTTDAFVDRGIPNAILADGPAGVRVQQQAVVGRRGTLKPIGAPIDVLRHVPKPIQRLLQGRPDRGEVRWQFATAFPAETALAQTWDVGLLEEVGRAVGTEMRELGVTFWLAPGINLHRNPLCGRNFEYYSEDPLLSGKLAAAITRGVQGVEGCYVTLKHFVANEAEDNRDRSDSRIDERALRELYLRPFEIAVREADPKAVMTSYNLVNGTYTPNSHDLCTKVLRNEWGFDGVVMTDWTSTGPGLADTATCMAVGNDLIMPGGKGSTKQILKALRSGAITEADLRRCAANVLRLVLTARP